MKEFIYINYESLFLAVSEIKPDSETKKGKKPVATLLPDRLDNSMLSVFQVKAMKFPVHW